MLKFRLSQKLAASMLPFAISMVWGGELPPDCTGPDSYPASAAYVMLKNRDILDMQRFNGDKTKVTRLASEQSGEDLYVQIHLVEFFGQNGEPLASVIVDNEVSSEECSVNGIGLYLIDRTLGEYARTPPP